MKHSAYLDLPLRTEAEYMREHYPYTAAQRDYEYRREFANMLIGPAAFDLRSISRFDRRNPTKVRENPSPPQ